MNRKLLFRFWIQVYFIFGLEIEYLAVYIYDLVRATNESVFFVC